MFILKRWIFVKSFKWKNDNKIWSAKFLCARITMVNLYHLVRFIMKYIWVSFSIHIGYHYWDIASFLFLGSILIWSLKCTINRKKLGSMCFFASHTLLFLNPQLLLLAKHSLGINLETLLKPGADFRVRNTKNLTIM